MPPVPPVEPPVPLVVVPGVVPCWPSPGWPEAPPPEESDVVADERPPSGSDAPAVASIVPLSPVELVICWSAAVEVSTMPVSLEPIVTVSMTGCCCSCGADCAEMSADAGELVSVELSVEKKR